MGLRLSFPNSRILTVYFCSPHILLRPMQLSMKTHLRLTFKFRQWLTTYRSGESHIEIILLDNNRKIWKRQPSKNNFYSKVISQKKTVSFLTERKIVIKGNHGGLCHQSGSYGGCDYAACGSTGTCNLTDNRHEIWKCEGRIWQFPDSLEQYIWNQYEARRKSYHMIWFAPFLIV